MKSGIYVIRNTVNSKVYVGSTIDFERRKQTHWRLLANKKHWNLKLSRSVEKHGLQNFVFETVEELPYEKALIIERENHFIREFDSKLNGYNIADASFGDCLTNHPNREAIVSKMKYSLRKRYEDPKERLKCSQPGEKNGMFGRAHSVETRKRQSQIAFDWHSRNESSLKGKTFEEIHGIEKAARLKNELSERAALKTGELNPFHSKLHTDESKAKMSRAMVGKAPPNKKKVRVDGMCYEGLYEASEKTGIKPTTIWYRVHSKNPKFEGYFYAEE